MEFSQDFRRALFYGDVGGIAIFSANSGSFFFALRLHSIWVIAKFLSNLRLSNLFSLSVEASVVLYWDMNDSNSGLSTNEKSSHIRQFYYVLQK